MALGKNIKTFREILGLTQQELSDRTGGVASQGAIAVLERRDSKTSEFTSVLAKALGLTTDELINGERGIPPIDNNLLRPPPLVYRRTIPVISKIPAGGAREIVDSYHAGAGFEEITPDVEVSATAFALVIDGDSMEPKFRTGDKVIIDPDVKPRPGDFVAFRCKRNGDDVEASTFKQYRPRGLNAQGVDYFELVPLNENYPTYRSDQMECVICGTMVEHRTYRRTR